MTPTSVELKQNSPPDLVGYQIQTLIGEGGMGKVYLAKDLRLHRQVAIKVLRGQTEGGSYAAMLDEARAIARINHPNVVQIYDVIEKGSGISLVMEYLQGHTLTTLQKQTLMSVEQKLQLLKQVSDGLEAVHQANLLHGDIKPSNIFVTNEGIVKVLDFGISSIRQQYDTASVTSINKARASENYGTYLYTSPERFRNGAFDNYSEMYSFGVMTFELLAGHLPFGKGGFAQTRQRVLSSEVANAETILPTLPMPLIGLINEMLSNEPEQRPGSFALVAERLGRISTALLRESEVEQETVLLEDTNQLAPIKRKSRVTTAALGVIALICIGYFGFEAVNLPAPRFVAVIPPTFSPESSIDEIQKRLVVATIDDALRQAVMYTEELQLISDAEVNAIKGSISDIAKATSVTDMLVTRLDCDNKGCAISLDRISGNNWTVSRRQQWSTQIEDAYSVFSSSVSKVSALFPEFGNKHLQHLVVSQQDYARYINLYNNIKFNNGENPTNLKQLKQLIVHSPHLYAGYALYRKTALNLYRDSQDITFIEDLKQLLNEAVPEYRSSHFYNVDQFWFSLYTDQFDLALQHLDFALGRGLDNLTELDLRAALYLEKNQPAKAAELYHRSLQLRFSTSQLYSLALSYWSMGETEKTKQSLYQLLEVIPNEYSANQLLGAILLFEGNVAESINILERLLSGSPQSGDLGNLSLAYALSGNIKEAQIMSARAVALSPKNVIVLLNLADMELLLGNTVVAHGLYNQLIDTLKEQPDLDDWLVLAQAYVHLGQQQAAVKALNAATKLSPDNGEVAYIGALVYTLLQEHQSALAKVEEALDSGIGQVWFNLPWFDNLCQYSRYRQLLPTRNCLVP